MGTQEPEGQPTGHPAWKEILDVIPEALHTLVKPTLEKWDKGVSERFAKIHEQYDPYKGLIEAQADPQDLQRAYMLLNQIQENPEEVVKQAIEAFELDYVHKSTIPEPTVDSSNDDYDYGFEKDEEMDLAQNPVFQQMTKTLEQLQSAVDAQKARDEELQAAEEHEAYLEELKEEHGEFNPMFVTALMAQGMDGVEAVKQYQGIVNQAAVAHIQEDNSGQQQTPPPVVMGADGTTGSGIPEVNTDVGTMSKTDVNDMVMQFLKSTES